MNLFGSRFENHFPSEFVLVKSHPRKIRLRPPRNPRPSFYLADRMMASTTGSTLEMRNASSSGLLSPRGIVLSISKIVLSRTEAAVIFIFQKVHGVRPFEIISHWRLGPLFFLSILKLLRR